MAEQLVINDVGPRDGLQNQPKILTVEEKLDIVKSLVDAKVEHIELGAFVSPKAVPAMAGTDQLFAAVAASGLQGQFSALVPNMKGYELALAAGCKTVAMVLYGSETMAQKNVRMSRLQALADTETMLKKAAQDGVEVIATIAVAWQCPFDGPTDPQIVRDTASKMLDQGASQLVIADTIGAANPGLVNTLMSDLVADNGAEKIGCHFHDTRALGMALVFAALETGIRRFDASIAGLGGCPFAPGASGNIATEDVVMMLHSMGFESGIDLPALLKASDLAEQLTGTAPGGRSKPWLKPFLEKNNGQLVPA